MSDEKDPCWGCSGTNDDCTDCNIGQMHDTYVAQKSEIAALRAQLAAAEERLEIESAGKEVRDAQVEALVSDLAAARADTVRGFAEWLKAHRYYIAGFDGVAARYLSSRGVPNAQPDDAGRVERGRIMKETMEQIFHWVIVDGMDLQDALTRILATTDGEVKP